MLNLKFKYYNSEASNYNLDLNNGLTKLPDFSFQIQISSFSPILCSHVLIFLSLELLGVIQTSLDARETCKNIPKIV